MSYTVFSLRNVFPGSFYSCCTAPATHRDPPRALQREIDFLTERHTIKLIQCCFLEPLEDAVGLWTLGFCLGVLNVVERQIELVLVSLRVPTNWTR